MAIYYEEVPFTQRQRVALKILTTLLVAGGSAGAPYIKERMGLVEMYTDEFMKKFPFPYDDEEEDYDE